MQRKQRHDRLYHYSCKINQYESIYKNDKIRLNTSKTYYLLLVSALSFESNANSQISACFA